MNEIGLLCGVHRTAVSFSITCRTWLLYPKSVAKSSVVKELFVPEPPWFALITVLFESSRFNLNVVNVLEPHRFNLKVLCRFN